jgi:hypothetical protein
MPRGGVNRLICNLKTLRARLATQVSGYSGYMSGYSGYSVRSFRRYSPDYPDMKERATNHCFRCCKLNQVNLEGLLVPLRCFSPVVLLVRLVQK